MDRVSAIKIYYYYFIITYMYINFQQNRDSRSVKTVLTSIFAKKSKLHKFATTNSNFLKNRLFQTCVIV